MTTPPDPAEVMKHLSLLSVVLLLLVACESAPGPSTPAGALGSDGFPAPDKEIVYETAVQAVAAYGFTPDLDMSVPEEGKLTTRWKLSLSPFSNQGHRDQVTVDVVECGSRPGFFQVTTKVNRQTNTNMQDPSNPVCADWGPGSRMPDMECMINGRIEMKFLPARLSPEFRQRYGLDSGYDPRICSDELKKSQQRRR